MEYLHEGPSLSENDDFGDNNFKQQSADKDQHSSVATGVDEVLELGNALHVALQVTEGNSGPGGNLPCEDEGRDLVVESVAAGECDTKPDGFYKTSSMPLQKCVAFHAEDFELEGNSLRRAVSLPTAGKLVSAMKGSREKEGIHRTKLTVSWAPDVYDPPPKSLSHNPKKKIITWQQIRSNKRNGKGKQKSKIARGGRSGPKDKRHYRKVGEWCLASVADSDRAILSHRHKSSAEQLDDDDGNGDGIDYDHDHDLDTADSNCGSRYLGKYHGAMHYAYTEAT